MKVNNNNKNKEKQEFKSRASSELLKKPSLNVS